MADQGTQAPRFEVRLTADTHWGWIRTRLSVERTLMSWVRTSVSLIGFGFTIVQFFERFNNMEGVSPAHHARPGPVRAARVLTPCRYFQSRRERSRPGAAGT